MTYTEYNKKKKEIQEEYNESIKQFKDVRDTKLDDIEKKYIKEHRKFKDGQKVIRTYDDSSELVTISGAGIYVGGEIGYFIKEDEPNVYGTMTPNERLFPYKIKD